MSQSQEDYMKFIHKYGEGDYVSNKHISEGLLVAPSSVSEMISRLDRDGLVDYRPYHGAKLTQRGQERAQAIIRKHLIWEYLLETKLGYAKDEVHDLAEVLEHATPADLADRLAEFIEYPED